MRTVRFPAKIGVVGKRREISVHAEQRFRDQKFLLTVPFRGRSQPPREIVDIAMTELHALCARKPDAIDDAGMVLASVKTVS